MVVVDCLSKKKKFIPLDSLKVEVVVQAFMERIRLSLYNNIR